MFDADEMREDAASLDKETPAIAPNLPEENAAAVNSIPEEGNAPAEESPAAAEAPHAEEPPVRPQAPSRGGYAAYTYIPTGEYTYAEIPQKKKRMPAWLVAILSVCTAVALVFSGAMLGRYLLPNGTENPSGPAGSNTTVPPTVDRGNVTLEVVERENGVPTEGSLPAVVASVAPSVVEIRTTTTVTNYYYDDYVQSGAGSGVLIRTSGDVSGLILTCNHVIDTADEGGITVVLADGRSFSGEEVRVLGQDVWSDLALLRIVDENGNTPADLTYATMATAAGGSSDYSYMTVGETVVAIGNPLGELGGSVSRGIISALGREVSIEGCPMTLMQVDASVNPGNSGGGLFNMEGQLIGIVNAKSTGDSVEGIGFAIPTSDAIPLVSELYRYGYVAGRPYLGLFFNAVTATGYYSISAYAYPDELPAGTTINYGDYLYAIDDVEITSDAALRSALAGKKEGDTVKVVLIRVQYRVQNKIELTLKVHAYTPEDAVHPSSGG